MRRSGLQILLFLLALTIQVVTPIAGKVAHARGFAGSSFISILCQSTDVSSRHGEGGPDLLNSGKQCLLCQSICDSLGFTLAFDQSSPVSASLWATGAFPHPQGILAVHRESGRYRARAPPFSSFSRG